MRRFNEKRRKLCCLSMISSRRKRILRSRQLRRLFVVIASCILLMFVLDMCNSPPSKGKIVSLNQRLLSGCEKQPIQTVGPYHTFRRPSRKTEVVNLPVPEGLVWETIENERIFPSSFDAMKSFEAYGSGLRKDIRSLEIIASRILPSFARTSRSLKGVSVTPIEFNSVYRKFDRIGGLQYILQFENVYSESNISRSYAVHVQESFGDEPCRVRLHRRNIKRRSLHILLPYNGGEEELNIFLKRFIYLRVKKRIDIVLIISVIKRSFHASFCENAVQKILKGLKEEFMSSVLVQEFKEKNHESFSRDKAIEEALKLVPSRNAVLFVCEVDVFIFEKFVSRCHDNMILESQIYLPVVYKLFSNSNNEPVVRMRHGYWELDNFVNFCIRKNDLKRLFNFQTQNASFDVLENAKNISLVPFRALEPGLVHLWNPSKCNIDSKSYKACLQKNAKEIGHPHVLGHVLEKMLRIIGNLSLEEFFINYNPKI